MKQLEVVSMRPMLCKRGDTHLDEEVMALRTATTKTRRAVTLVLRGCLRC
jgi:hypothetical protein